MGGRRRNHAEPQATSSAQLYRLIMDNLPCGTARIDAHGSIVEFNAAAEAITGYRIGEVLGRPHATILHGAADSAACPLTSGRGATTLEAPVRCKSGALKTVTLTTSPLYASETEYIGGFEFFSDVSDSRRCEKERSHFMAMLAHDMRNPVVVMGGFLSRLESGKVGPVTEDQRRDLRLLIDEAGRLEGLITRFLEFTEVEAKPFRPVRAPFDLLDAVSRQIRLSEEQAKSKNITVACTCDAEAPALVHADAALMDRVLINLLDNALKYTGPGGSVQVRISDCGTRLLFEITDTGTGIPEDELPCVFDAFHRARWDVQGTGLGLAIVKKIIDAHGGSITVDSIPGQGSTFCFTVARAERPGTSASLSPAIDNAGLR